LRCELAEAGSTQDEQAQIEEARGNAETAFQELSEATGTVERLRGELAEAEAQVAQVKPHASRDGSLTSWYEEDRGATDEAPDVVKASNVEHFRLPSKESNLGGTPREANASEQVARLEALKLQVEQLEEEQAQLEAHKVQADTKIAALEERNSRLEAAKVLVANLEVEHAQAVASQSEVEEQFLKATSAGDRLQTELADAGRRLEVAQEAWQHEASQARTELAAEAADRSRLEAELATMEGTVGQLREDLATAQAAAETAALAVAELAAAASADPSSPLGADTGEELEEAARRLEEVNFRVLTLDGELDAARQAGSALRAQLARAASEAQGGASTLARVRSEVSEERRAAADLRVENAGLERDVLDLARMLTELKSAVHQYAVAGGSVPCASSMGLPQ